MRILSLFALSLTLASATAQSVVINELSATQSDRVLQFPAGGPARLGPLGQRWCDPGPLPTGFASQGIGPFGFGYGNEGTVLQSRMAGKALSLYLRKEIILTAAQAALTDPAELVLNYDDGAVVCINGVELARRNLGAAGTFVYCDQPAFNRHDAGTAETITLGAVNAVLREGVNTIAIQVQNNAFAEGGTDIPTTAPGGGRLRCETTLRIGGASPQTLIAPADSWNYFVGVHEPSGGLLDPVDISAPLIAGPDWTQLSYPPAASWTEGPGAIGFDSGTDYYRAANIPGSQLSTNLISMLNTRMAVFMRRSFDLTQAQLDGITSLNLTADWDDGYVLFLNGYEISRNNLPGNPGTQVGWDQPASGHNASTDGGFFGNPQPNIVAVLSIDKSRLRAGTNVIAAQLHNSATNSSDLMLDVRFTAAGATPLTLAGKDSLWRYFIPAAEFAVMPPATTSSGPAFLDWVELRNTTAAPVSLAGWALSDEADTPMKWVFPATAQIPANGFLTVACSGRDLKPSSGLLHTNFSLDQDGESLTLRDASGILVHQVTQVPDQDFFHTWGLDPASGQMRYFDTATPGAANTGTAFTAVAARPVSDKETGFYNSPFSINLSTTTPGATIRYTLDSSDPTAASAVYTGTLDPTPPLSSGPGLGYILREVWNNAPGVFRAPAAIPVGTTPTATSAITSFESPTNAGDWYGQRVRGILQVTQTGTYTFYLATDDDGELYFSQTDSPAGKFRIAYIQSNWAGVREWNKLATQRSVPLTLTAGQRYYIEALESEGSGGDNLAVGWTGPGFPSITVIPGNFLSPPDGITAGITLPTGTCVRARAFAPGMIPSEIMTRNYALNYPAAVHTSPAIFLTGEGGRTFYKPNGIFSIQAGSWGGGDWVPGNTGTDYNFCLMRGEAFERPAVMEVVRPDNSLHFRTTVGTRFAGSPWSRPKYLLADIDTANWNSGWTTKPQLNLYFRGDLGMARLQENGFIPGSNLNEWDTLRLRAGKNDAYNPFIIDEWMRRTYRVMGNHPSPLGFFSTLFLNGKLKSYFNPTERPRDTFFQEFYDTPNEWDVHYIGEWESGDSVAFNQMYNYFRNTDFTAYANYQGGAALWDPVNAADYYIINAWGATKDWPGNNYAFARERAPGKLWRFSMWDAEGAMGMFGQPNTANTFTEDLMLTAPASETFIMRLVFVRFQQNAEWRMLFADRLQRHFFNGGAMQQSVGQLRWNSLRDQVKPAIQALQGSAFYEGHWGNWANRTPTFLTQCRNVSLWPVTQAPAMAPFGGTITPGNTVSLTNPNGTGTLYVTTDGSDPRLVGGAASPLAQTYSAPIPVTQPATIKARVLNGAEWSPLTEASFAPPPPRVLITEIHYNPPGPDDLTEFVELTNTGGGTVSLNGAHFTTGIEFTFGNVTLDAGQRFVIVKDAAAFAAAYPSVPVAGVFTGGLKNSGDTLTLVDIAGNLITSVTYSDSSEWPILADGDGASLVLMHPGTTTDVNDPAAWRASALTGGTPGGTDGIAFPAGGDINADLDGDGFPALIEHALGSSDTDSASAPIIATSIDGGVLTISVERRVGADDVSLEAVTGGDFATWSSATLISDVPRLDGKSIRTWQCGTPSASRVLVKIRASLRP
jgi:hypothetical protein